MGAVRKSYPRFRRAGDAPRIDLTEDDVAILRHVFRHRFIRADDLYRLFGDRSQDKLSRRLTRLYRNQFIDRPIAQVDRYHEGGSRALVYGLDSRGARYLKETLGVAVSSADWKARNRSYTRDNLDHTLSISRFMVDMELACRVRGDLALIPSDEIVAGAPERARRSAQPGRWSVSVPWHGSRVDVQIVPDAIFGLRTAGPDGRPLRSFVFLEIDRGTMTIAPAKQVRESEAFLYRTSVLRKLLTYAESHRQGLHQAHLGLPAARVLTLTTSPTSAEAMRSVAHQLIVAPLKLPPGLFLFGVQPDGRDPLATEFSNSEGIGTRLIRRTT